MAGQQQTDSPFFDNLSGCFPKQHLQFFHAVEKCRDQKCIRKDPREGAGKAGRKKSEHRNQAESNQGSCCHFADSGEDRKGRKAHSLDGETDNVDKG